MYNFPGVAVNTTPQIGDTVIWDGEKWVAGNPTPDYSTQATWFIDPINGNDANDGLTPATIRGE